MNSAGFGRSFPSIKKLQGNPDHARILQQAVVRHRVTGELSNNPALNAVYKYGWLHAELAGEESQYIFPTEVHRRYTPLDIVFGSMLIWTGIARRFSVLLCPIFPTTPSHH
jgi:hypothetical protein